MDYALGFEPAIIAPRETVILGTKVKRVSAFTPKRLLVASDCDDTYLVAVILNGVRAELPTPLALVAYGLTAKDVDASAIWPSPPCLTAGDAVALVIRNDGEQPARPHPCFIGYGHEAQR